MTINRILQMLCERFCKPETPRPFTVLRHRCGKHILLVLRAAYPNANIRIADSEYSTVSIDEFGRWLKSDDISTRIYQKEWYDCDDSARAIRCRIFAIGQEYKTTFTIAYCEGHTSTGEYHAFNLMLDNTDQLHILEPQTDRTMLYHNSGYKPDFIQL